MNDALKGAIGISLRARKATLGTDAVKDAVRKTKAKLVLLSSTASARSRQDLRNTCQHYNIPLLEGDFSAMFEELTGKMNMIVVSINDTGLAQLVQSKITK